MILKYFIELVDRIFTDRPVKNIIILESVPDYGCNTYPVYQYMLEDAYFDNHRFYWFISGKGRNKGNKDTRTNMIPIIDKNPYNMIRRYLIRATAQVIITSNLMIRKKNSRTLQLFLSHGSKVKKTRGRYEVGSYVDYVLCQSHFFDDVICHEYNVSTDKLIYTGFPRNDYLYKDNSSVMSKLNVKGYIVWMPTFRQHKLGSEDIKYRDDLGLPIIYNDRMLEDFNRICVSCGIHIIYKPHPAQDLDYIKAMVLSNFKIISDDYIAELGIQLYELIGASEGLITDYSSVFYDCLLLNKPIAITMDDIEEYHTSRGLALDLEQLHESSCELITDYQELVTYVEHISQNIDCMASKRQNVCDLTNMYQDAGSTERVVSFIKKNIKDN